MIPLQTISVFFGICMLYIVRLHFRKQQLKKTEYIAWCILWSGFVAAALFPQSFQSLIQTLHIARVFDLFVIIACMILSLLVLLNRFALTKLEKKLETLVRKDAIHETKQRTTKN